MPTLIRLLVLLLVLVGIAYGAMFALVALVDPGEEEISIRIPPRDLLPPTERDPLIRREIDTSRPVEVPAASDPEPAVPAAGGAAPDDGTVVTLSPGTE